MKISSEYLWKGIFLKTQKPSVSKGFKPALNSKRFREQKEKHIEKSIGLFHAIKHFHRNVPMRNVVRIAVIPFQYNYSRGFMLFLNLKKYCQKNLLFSVINYPQKTLYYIYKDVRTRTTSYICNLNLAPSLSTSVEGL